MQQKPQYPDLVDDAKSKLTVALDFPSARLALDCVDRLDGACKWVKVGLELYCASGNDFIETLRSRGLEVFLDLKLHDIPNTIAKAIQSIAHVDASLLTVHAAGGEAMLNAAVQALHLTGNGPRLLAVTLLTSMDKQQMQGVGLHLDPASQVLRLARLAVRCGIEGLVCSAEEVTLLREHLGTTLFLVVPGIRLIGDPNDDQRRIATPLAAMQAGASMLVVGRPITRAPDPSAAAQTILAEIAKAAKSTSVRPIAG